MRTYLVWLVLLVLNISALRAQQLPARSPFGASDFCWNPAMTAIEQEWELEQVRFRHKRRHHTCYVADLDAPELKTLDHIPLVSQLVVGVEANLNT